jgi:hypothetical protein
MCALTGSRSVLYSTFNNRGWFGQYVVVSIPFIMIGFMSRFKAAWFTGLLFFSLVICEIALILAGGRAAWVTYPVILFCCWGLHYFADKGDELALFRLKSREWVKIVLSVPITILVSLFLIFQVLMPLSDYFSAQKKAAGKQSQSIQEKQSPSASTARMLKDRADKIADPSARVVVWNQGVDVGREQPVFGLGYMAFSWHAHLLSELPESFYMRGQACVIVVIVTNSNAITTITQA